MMYTPTPQSRRPRPPSSIAKSRLRNSTSTAPTALPLGAMSSMASDSTLASTSSSNIDGPESPTDRAEQFRSRLSRISASPEQSDIGNVSLMLDSALDRPIPSPSAGSRIGIGLGLPTALSSSRIEESAQPSPPPPYGQELPSADPLQGEGAIATTPPRQDSGHPSRRTSTTPSEGDGMEDKLRQRRATDAAKAIGLDIDFGASASDSGEESEGLSDTDAKQRLKSVRKRLRQRDNELLMAAQIAEQALRTHEELLSHLSPRTRAKLPDFMQLLAAVRSPRSTPRPSHIRHSSARSISTILSPGSSREGSYFDSPPNDSDRLRTLRLVDGLPLNSRKASRPKALKRIDSPSQKELYYAQLQQAELDERIGQLEAALAEAQTGEEHQRKAAARLRRENDKVMRDLERAEKRLGEVGTIRIPVARPSRREIPAEASWSARPRPTRAISVSSENEEETDEWSERDAPMPMPLALPLPAATSSRRTAERRMSDLLDKLERMSEASRSRSVSPQLPENETLRGHFNAQRSTSPVEQSSRMPIPDRRVRKKISSSSFLSPPKSKIQTSPAPRVTVHSPVQSPRYSSVRSRRSYTPSPAKSIASLASLATRLSLSPGYHSLSTRMASMRDYVSGHLVGRTLGSELGLFSEYDSLSTETAQGFEVDADASGSDEWVDELDDHNTPGTDPDTTPFSSPAALPPAISAALSSLAHAFGPGGVWQPPAAAPRPGSATKRGLSRIKVSPRWSRSETSPSPARRRLVNNEWQDITRDKGKARAEPSRPLIQRAGSSQSSIALAHRRVSGLVEDRPATDPASDLFSPVARSAPHMSTSPVASTSTSSFSTDDEYQEPETVPGKLVHDLWVWCILILEWAVCLFVLFVRMGLDLQEGKRGIMAKNRNDRRRKRYYL